MEKFQSLVTLVGGLSTLGSFGMMLYMFKTFITKPQTTMRDELVALRTELDLLKLEAERNKEEIYRRLDKGNRKFEDQDKTNEVILHSTLALIEFEIQFCITEGKPISADLDKVKEELHKFLARR